MYSISIISSVVTIILSVLVLTALRINQDDSESTKWIRTAIRTNICGLAIVLVTYSLCAYDIYMHGGASGNRLFRIAYILTDAADFVMVPVSICVVEYIGVIVHADTELEKTIRRVRRSIAAIGLILIIPMAAFIILRLCGRTNPQFERTVYIVFILAAHAILALSCFVIFQARKKLGTLRLACFVLYIAGEIISIQILWYSNESVFFAVAAGLLIFLLLAMQTERIQMSNVETVMDALDRAEHLNLQLKESMEDLEREQFLLKEISNIYNSLHLVDLKNGTFRELKAPPSKAAPLLRALQTAPIQRILWSIMERVCSVPFVPKALLFTEFETLSDRMRGRKIISFEAINDENQWIRFSFIRIGSDLQDDILEVVFSSENINREKREKEYLEQVSFTDELTGVGNRNAYIQRCNSFVGNALPPNLWIMVTDLNGLKYTNDTIGHEAGDELLAAAASVLQKAIGSAGQVYRTGGDEFISVVTANEIRFREIMTRMHALREAWKGRFSGRLLFSTGTAGSDQHPGIGFEELEREADRKMYADKEAFYETHTEMSRRSAYRLPE